MDLRALLLAPCLLVGCGDGSTPDATPPAAAVSTAAALPEDVVGRWAADPELCGRFGWRISSRAITSDSGVACALESLRPNAGGWTASASCVDDRGGVIELNPAPGDPATLVISGAPFAAPLDLVRCTPGDPPARDPHAPLEAAAQVDLAIVSDPESIVSRTDENNAVVRRAWWRDGELLKIVEPTVGRGEGPRRSYYFRPGESEPFLIRSPEGAFAFADGRLMQVFSPEGEVLGELARQRLEEEARRGASGAEIARRIAAALAPETAASPATRAAP